MYFGMSTLKRLEPMLLPWIFFSRRNVLPSNATAAEHRDDRAGLDARGVQRRADSSGHPAANERGTVQWHIVAHLHDGVGVNQHLVGIGGEVGELVDRLALPAESRRCILGANRSARTQVRAAGKAVLATPAEH